MRGRRFIREIPQALTRKLASSIVTEDRVRAGTQHRNVATRIVLRALLREARGVVTEEGILGRIPAVLTDGEKCRWPKMSQDVLLSLERKQIRRLLRKLGELSFLSRVFDMEIYSQHSPEKATECLRVLPRNVVL
eukprot:c20892_g1_i4 orf=543-947(-)